MAISKVEICGVNTSKLPVLTSEEKETFAYYEQLEAVNPKVHVVYYKGHFNYSAINNFGVQYAKGEYFLLLNNDTEIINDDCL